MPAAEKPGENTFQALVDVVEGLLKPGAGFALNLSNCLFQGVQGGGKVVVLRIEILLTLRLLVELLNCGKIDRTESFDLFAHFLKHLLPAHGIGVSRHFLEDHLQRCPVSREILHDGLTTYFKLPNLHPQCFHCLPR